MHGLVSHSQTAFSPPFFLLNDAIGEGRKGLEDLLYTTRSVSVGTSDKGMQNWRFEVVVGVNHRREDVCLGMEKRIMALAGTA